MHKALCSTQSLVAHKHGNLSNNTPQPPSCGYADVTLMTSIFKIELCYTQCKYSTPIPNRKLTPDPNLDMYGVPLITKSCLFLPGGVSALVDGGIWAVFSMAVRVTMLERCSCPVPVHRPSIKDIKFL